MCACNSVSGIALAICCQSKGELNNYSFCWQCTHSDQPTDVRLFVCMLVLTVHVIIIFTHSAMNAVEVGFSRFLWASSTVDRKWILTNNTFLLCSLTYHSCCCHVLHSTDRETNFSPHRSMWKKSSPSCSAVNKQWCQHQL